MKLPQRIPQHISESASHRIFVNKLPDNWILRDVTERDYGIDYYLELVNKNNELTGDLVLIQLKAKKSIKWTKTGKFNLTGIKPSTNNYWYQFVVPVFIFLVDRDKEECYYVSVKHSIRQNFEKLLKEEPIKYTFEKSISRFDKDSEILPIVFQVVYFIEKHRKQYESEIIYFLSNLDGIIEFFDMHIGKDSFLGVYSWDMVKIESIYTNFYFLCYSLQIDWNIPNILEFEKKSRAKYGNTAPIYEEHVEQIVLSLKEKIPSIIKRIKQMFKHENLYWKYKNYSLIRFVEQIDETKY